MLIAEYFEFLATSKPETTIGPDLGPDRTLLLGCNSDCQTHHLYQQAGLLHLLVYDGDQNPVAQAHGRKMTAAALIPNKFLFPEACDAAFCQRLKTLGQSLPFTRFNEKRHMLKENFYGLVLDEIPVKRRGNTQKILARPTRKKRGYDRIQAADEGNVIRLVAARKGPCD